MEIERFRGAASPQSWMLIGLGFRVTNVVETGVAGNSISINFVAERITFNFSGRIKSCLEDQVDKVNRSI